MTTPAISSSFPHRAATLCGLYFAQGIPWGFVTIALVAHLNEQGVSRQETAGLIAMSLLPWTFKLIWGPIIDSFQLPAMGLRRPWILIAQLLMAATLFAASTNEALTDPNTLRFLILVFFVHNCFASLQDVATDAMAMDLLAPSERGRMNGFMWGSKLVGISLGGIVFAPVIARSGLSAGVRLQGGVILLIMLLPLLIRERPGEKLLPWSKGERMAPEGATIRTTGKAFGLRLLAGPIAVGRELRRAFGLRTTMLAAAVALVSFVCEGFHDATTPAVFTQTLGWTAEAYARVQGIWGLIGKLVGALLGGYLCDRYGRRLLAGAAATLSAVTFAGFGLTAAWWTSDSYLLPLFILVIQGSIAMTQVSLFSLFMKISWTGAAATQFTVFMTLLNLGTAVGPLLTRLYLSDADSYVLCGVIAFAPVLLLPLLRPDEVEQRKQDELTSNLVGTAAI